MGELECVLEAAALLSVLPRRPDPLLVGVPGAPCTPVTVRSRVLQAALADPETASRWDPRPKRANVMGY